MTSDEFKIYVRCWLDKNAVDESLFKTDYYINTCINEAMQQDCDGEFYFENDEMVLGKFYHRITLDAEYSKSGYVKTINYMALGIGFKDNKGELFGYDELDFMII